MSERDAGMTSDKLSAKTRRFSEGLATTKALQLTASSLTCSGLQSMIEVTQKLVTVDALILTLTPSAFAL